MPISSRMSSIMGQIESEHPELFALEFRKIAKYDFVYNLASTNINQSALNFVQMCMTIRARMSSIMELIGPEPIKSALEFENLPYLTVYTLATANIDQSVPNLATIYIPIRSQMSLIMGQIEQNIRSYLPLNLENLLNMTVYTLASTNINQSTPNLVKM